MADLKLYSNIQILEADALLARWSVPYSHWRSWHSWVTTRKCPVINGLQQYTPVFFCLRTAPYGTCISHTCLITMI